MITQRGDMSNFGEQIGSKKKDVQLKTLPDIILPNDPENESEDNDDPMVIITKAEERARAEQKRNSHKNLLGSDRHYAKLLHREADQLHLRGDYEAALVLYHKAASICPRDSSHSVAARRTTEAISSAANPSPALRKLLPKARNGAELSATLCPEAAAIRAENILKNSIDPSSVIPEILEKDFWKVSSPSSNKMALRLSHSQIMQRQLSSQAKSSLSSLVSFFNAGDFKSTLKIGQELISLASGLRDPHRYLVEAYHYLALIHVPVRRHDRAVNNVSQMIYAAKASGNSALFTKSLVTLGVVHLSFGHLDAVCHAWEYLFPDLEDLIPQAWILHEMGRCHLESGRYLKALKLAIRCQETAEEASSKKWLLHGKLLSGQSLLKLGKYGEAYEALKVSAKITEEEGDTPTLCYIQDLINQVSRILRQSMLTIAKEPFDNSLKERTARIDRKFLKDEAFRWGTIEDKMLLKKPDNEISSGEKGERQVLPRGNDHSITARTYVLNGEFDLDSIRSKNTEATYVIRKGQDEISSRLSLETQQNTEEDFTFDISETDDSDLKNILKQHSATDKQSKHSKILSQREKECESRVLRTLSEISESQDLKTRAEEEVSLSDELLSKNLDERITMNAGAESRNGESKSPEKCFEVDTDWRLDFVTSPEDEDLVEATESIQTGRTYSLVATHALYRHSLPSSPREKTEKSCTFKGFTATPELG